MRRRDEQKQDWDGRTTEDTELYGLEAERGGDENKILDARHGHGTTLVDDLTCLRSRP